jgi:hypothetical protein
LTVFGAEVPGTEAAFLEMDRIGSDLVDSQTRLQDN